MMKTVLVVEDERQIAGIAKDYLQHAGYAVFIAEDGIEALAMSHHESENL